jgi:hypothetical protein
MGWQLERRLRWYGKKTAEGFRRFGESARR